MSYFMLRLSQCLSFFNPFSPLDGRCLLTVNSLLTCFSQRTGKKRREKKLEAEKREDGKCGGGDKGTKKGEAGWRQKRVRWSKVRNWRHWDKGRAKNERMRDGMRQGTLTSLLADLIFAGYSKSTVLVFNHLSPSLFFPLFHTLHPWIIDQYIFSPRQTHWNNCLHLKSLSGELWHTSGEDWHIDNSLRDTHTQTHPHPQTCMRAHGEREMDDVKHPFLKQAHSPAAHEKPHLFLPINF